MNIQQTAAHSTGLRASPRKFYSTMYKLLYIREIITFRRCSHLIFLYIIGYNNISWKPYDPSLSISGGRDPKLPGLKPMISTPARKAKDQYGRGSIPITLPIPKFRLSHSISKVALAALAVELKGHAWLTHNLILTSIIACNHPYDF